MGYKPVSVGSMLEARGLYASDLCANGLYASEL